MWLTKLEQLTDPKYGLTVRFESGWKRRGASGGAQMKAVAGVLWHHDVSPRSGTYPLRNMLRNGRAGLSGPLCHIGFDRDGTVWIVGAGKANHAGTGSVPGVVRNGGNTRLIGIEMTSAGTRPWDWTAAQLRQMPKLGAALSDIFGLSTSQHWAHYEYQNGKIDPAGLPGNMPGLRSRIGAVRFNGSAPAPSAPVHDPARPWRSSPRVAGMATAEVKRVQAEVGVTQDGIYGNQTGRAVRDLQEDLDLTADGVWGPTTGAEVASIKAIVTQNQKEIRQARDHAKRAADVATVNQRTIRETNSRVGPIGRDGRQISLRQEVADAKTLGLALRGEIAGLEKALQDVKAGEALDLDQVRAAAQEGVSQALRSVEADVTVTIAEG